MWDFSLFLMHTHTRYVRVSGYCVYVCECCICMCERVYVCTTEEAAETL